MMNEQSWDLYWKSFMAWSATLRPCVEEWTKAVGSFEETFASGYNAGLDAAAKQFTDMSGEKMYSGEAAAYCYGLKTRHE